MEYPRTTVWYVEARPEGGPRATPRMGSAVAVRIFKQGEPNSYRTVLLTCLHVVRGTAADGQDGYGDPMAEFLAWRPATGYAKPDDFAGRVLGTCKGSFPSSISDIRPQAKGSVPVAQREPAGDWVLLEVTDPAFQHVLTVYDFGRAVDGQPLSVVGYPGGAATWETGRVVENDLVPDFTQTRQSPHPGTLMLDGKSPTGAGMSGGGVFDAAGRLVGLHRSQTAVELAFGAVDAHAIRNALLERGWSISVSLPDKVENLSEASKKVTAGLQELADLTQNAPANSAARLEVQKLKPSLAQLGAQLDALEACKECHDILLHRAGRKVGQCIRALQQWQRDPGSLEFRFEADRALTELDLDAQNFARLAPRCTSVYLPAVTEAQDLQAALQEVRSCLGDPAKQAGALFPIEQIGLRIIEGTPVLLQVALGQLASRLPFGELAGLVTDPDFLAAIGGASPPGLMDLIPLQSDTRQMVDEHFAWQELDKDIRSMRPDIEGLAKGNESLLPRIGYMAGRLLTKTRALATPGGEMPLVKLAEDLATFPVQANPDLSKVLNVFLTLAAQADDLFGRMDQRLLVACQRLTQITKPLQQLLTTLAA